MRALIIHGWKVFARLIFATQATGKNFLRVKSSRSTVLIVSTHVSITKGSRVLEVVRQNMDLIQIKARIWFSNALCVGDYYIIIEEGKHEELDSNKLAM